MCCDILFVECDVGNFDEEVMWELIVVMDVEEFVFDICGVIC